MTAAGSVFLKPGKERSLLRRHPWVYAGAIAQVRGAPAGGDLVAVHAADKRFLAWAAWSPDSTIRLRCWSFREADRIDEAWLADRIGAAVARRRGLDEVTDAVRLVYAEADFLPGLIADRYGDQLVVQMQAAGVERHREALLDALCHASGCGNVFDRSDGALRAREGLPGTSGVLRGEAPPDVIEVREHGVRFGVEVRRGHKTGFYIDQRDNRRRIADLVRAFRARHGRAPRVLNCFCYTGGFSLAAALAGAETVVSVDSSADALALARANAERNGIVSTPASAAHPPAAGGGVQWRCADVFEELRAMRARGERFDLIVLDPPKFAANHHQVDRAARAYKDINLNGLRLLDPGGHLLTFSCSGAIDADLFQKIVAGAVIDADVECDLRARLAAGSDHPIRMTHPESEYLKGLWLERGD